MANGWGIASLVSGMLSLIIAILGGGPLMLAAAMFWILVAIYCEVWDIPKKENKDDRT